MAFSWSGLAYEWSRLTASDSTPSATSCPTAWRTAPRSSGLTTAPSIDDPLGNLASQVPLDQRARLLPGHVVEPRHPQPAELEDVAEAHGREQAGPGALALEDGVRRDRAAVDDVADRGGIDRVAAEDRPDAVRHAAAEVLGRRGELARVDCPGRIADDDVGECAADVDADADPSREAGLALTHGRVVTSIGRRLVGPSYGIES